MEIAYVGRKIVAVFGESVSVSASWNASLRPLESYLVSKGSVLGDLV